MRFKLITINNLDGIVQNCTHKNKSGIFKMAEIRRKFKTLGKKKNFGTFCEDCDRLDSIVTNSVVSFSS